jgi:hypothetical protein
LSIQSSIAEILEHLQDEQQARASQPTMRCVHDEIQATGAEARYETAQWNRLTVNAEQRRGVYLIKIIRAALQHSSRSSPFDPMIQ